jgi:hypothetical protein
LSLGWRKEVSFLASWHHFSVDDGIMQVPILQNGVSECEVYNPFILEMVPPLGAEYSKGSAVKISFSHVHLYVDHVKDVEEYKQLEDRLNAFDEAMAKEETLLTADAKRKLFQSLSHDSNGEFVTEGRDVVKQLIACFGFRVTASRFPSVNRTNTRSVLVTSRDLEGVQFVVTSIDETPDSEKDQYQHFDASKYASFLIVLRLSFFRILRFTSCILVFLVPASVKLFLRSHSNRQGIAVLGFITNDVDAVHERYRRLHPKLIHDFSKYDDGDVKILEVFAYYDEGNGEADMGTILRFLERKKGSSGTSGDVTGRSCLLLPGLTTISANFDRTSHAAYCDHWVSNVFSRTGFLSTLQDTLGFTPKVRQMGE